jgi:uncharacterized protein
MTHGRPWNDRSVTGTTTEPVPKASLRDQAMALGVGALGGGLFFALAMPLAWMMGSMVFVSILALSGQTPVVEKRFRGVMVAILGVFLGSAFSPEVIDRAVQWAQALLVLFVYIVIGSGIVYIYLRRVAKFDPVTSYFASTPGGLSEMVLASEALGGDPRRVSLVHTTRVLLIVLIIPFWFRLVMDVDVPAMMPPKAGVVPQVQDWLILVACAVIGWPLARLCRIPAAALVGPMVVSAVAHLLGLTYVTPPPIAVAAGQLVLGASVGCRFAGTALSLVWQTVRTAFVTTLMLLGLAIIAMLLFSDMIGVQPEAMALVLSPGGLAEMSLIALALGIDTAFVSTMHVFRIAIVVILAPSLYRIFRRG